MNWEHQLAVEIGNQEEALLPEALKARNLCKQKKYGQALEVLWKMLRSARRSRSKEREAFVLIHIGKVYRNWIWDVALKFFQDGLATAKSCGFMRGVMTAYNAIAELYYEWGKQDKALEYYKKCMQAACTLNDQSCQRDILLDMVNCYEERGDFDRCDELLQEAVRLDEELGVPSLKDDLSRLSIVAGSTEQ